MKADSKEPHPFCKTFPTRVHDSWIRIIVYSMLYWITALIINPETVCVEQKVENDLREIMHALVQQSVQWVGACVREPSSSPQCWWVLHECCASETWSPLTSVSASHTCWAPSWRNPGGGWIVISGIARLKQPLIGVCKVRCYYNLHNSLACVLRTHCNIKGASSCKRQ